MAFPIIVDTSSTVVTGALRRAGNFFDNLGRFPQLVLGDERPYRIRFLNGVTPESWNGNAAYSIELAVGTCGAPESGTFTLTVDETTEQTTAALPVGSTASAVQAAIEALSNVGAGNVVVTGSNGLFEIEFVGDLADTLVGVTSDIVTATPDARTIVVDQQVGGSGDNQIWSVQLQQSYLAFQDTWTPYTDGSETGWEGTISTASLALAKRIQDVGGVTSTIEIKVYDDTNKPRTYVKQPVEILCRILNPGAFSPAPMQELALATLANVRIPDGKINLFPVRNLTMTGNIAINRLGRPYQYLDPDGVNRDVDFAATWTGGESFIVKNTGSAGDLIIKDNGAEKARVQPGYTIALQYDEDAAFRILSLDAPTSRLSVIAEGAAAYDITTTAAAVTFSVQNPVLTLPQKGRWNISMVATLRGAGLTIDDKTVTIKTRRTNNTAADLTGGGTTLPLEFVGAVDTVVATINLPLPEYVTANSDDDITIFAELSGAATAGEVQVSEARLIAQWIGF